ncbi:AmmeMemoRadiSam system protein A [Nitrospira sp. Kam-Ns4a]
MPVTCHLSPVTRDSPHPLLRLAAEAITVYLSEQRIIEPPAGLFVAVPEALKPAGVFVCLKRKGELRGCIGTTEPLCETAAQEVIHNAIGAATRDPRFQPVRLDELLELAISVDLLSPLEPVAGPDELDPRRYGLVLRSGERRSVLLPDIEGIESVDDQVNAARVKAGVGPLEPVQLFRFEVTRYQ